MNEDEWKEWRENPITNYFFKYLKNESRAEAVMLADIIQNGNILSESEQIQISTECATLIRIADIEYDDIESFYNEKE